MLELKDIRKQYTTGSFTQVALDGVSVAFRDNEFVAILGPSGSGKTTLLNVVGGLDHFDSGDLVIDGVSTKDYKDRDWDTYRNNRIGFVFQSYNLIPHQTVLENVELALTLSGVGRAERKRRAQEALERVGLGEHANKRPAQLSGGQMQRVAIARALINDPEILLADEPTGALDSVTSVQVMDLLKEVASDRLVIMVTHNPDLAEKYATRIVRLTDGRITDDSDPFDPSAVARRAAKPARRARMGFSTALGLSFRNLMTKKGRTFMVAFAGAIGIIGIAAILALSNGVNAYIQDVEEEMLSSYPLTISSSASDMSSLLTSDTAELDDEADEDDDDTASTSADTSSSLTSALVTVAYADETDDEDDVDLAEELRTISLLSSMFSTVGTNDLASLREYLESDECDIYDYVSYIQYDYGISPLVYSADTSDGVIQLNPNALTSLMESMYSSSSAVSSMTVMSSVTSSYNEMIDNMEVLESEYELVAGEWADEADECVLVLNSAGSVTDYTLYSIGVYDPDELSDMVSAMTESASGTDDVEIPDHSDVAVTYDDILGLSFKVLAACDVYRYNSETGGWTDMSDDEEFIAEALEDALDLTIVGIVKASSSDSSALTEGIAYTHALTVALMERAAESEIVQQQLADPDTDVFTNTSFDELIDEASAGVDLAEMFSIDEDAITIDLSGVSLSGVDLSSLDLSGIDLSSVSLDLSGMDLSDLDIDYETIIGEAPAPDFELVLAEVDLDLGLTEEDYETIVTLGTTLLSGFIVSLEQTGSGLDITDENLAEELVALLQEYLATEEAQLILAEVDALAGEPVREKLEEVLLVYVEEQLAPYLQEIATELMASLTEQLSETISAQLQEQLSAVLTEQLTAVMTEAMTQMMTSLTQSISTELQTQLASALESAFSVDADAFEGAITFTMDIEDLSSLLTSYANASSLTYENNLATLGYATEDDPSSITIYPIDFEAKEAVIDIIDAYNDAMEAAGEDDKVIVYTDYVGLLMSGVTDIVNMISTVLIAFVSISLVVSSIMIAVITYISVLERKKEIGILRAMGASKGNVGSIFNAETFIEGLISGLLAIGVVYLASIPVNILVDSIYGVEQIMQLPATSAAVLVLISVALTLIAGIIPANSASHRDPVEALRSE